MRDRAIRNGRSIRIHRVADVPSLSDRRRPPVVVGVAGDADVDRILTCNLPKPDVRIHKSTDMQRFGVHLDEFAIRIQRLTEVPDVRDHTHTFNIIGGWVDVGTQRELRHALNGWHIRILRLHGFAA